MEGAAEGPVTPDEAVEARAPALARWLIAGLALPCAAAALALAFPFSARGAVGAAALLLPSLVAVSAWRARWRAGPDGLRVRTIAGERLHTWDAVLRADRVRGGAVVAARGASHRTTWLTRSDRERVLRAVVTRAGLRRVWGDALPQGVLARWVRPPARRDAGRPRAVE